MPRRARYPLAALVAFGVALSTPAFADGDASALGWLAGHWCSERDGALTEELWLPPAGGQMLGLSRTLRDGQLRSFEFMRIALAPEGLVYLAQPNGRPAVAFQRVEHTEASARFDNPDHDFPRSIRYARRGPQLEASIAGPGRDGSERRIDWQYARCDATDAGSDPEPLRPD